jgi:hypothetical protein
MQIGEKRRVIIIEPIEEPAAPDPSGETPAGAPQEPRPAEEPSPAPAR